MTRTALAPLPAGRPDTARLAADALAVRGGRAAEACDAAKTAIIVSVDINTSIAGNAASTAISHGPRQGMQAFARAIARLAVRSLHAELCLYPKPGLVSLVDNGSHTDMNAVTFMRSLFSLRHYFRRICLAGLDDAPFSRLRQLGIEAEAAMLRATRGVNTHRGAIFSLGLLCAAAGRARALGTPITPSTLRAALLARWGGELVSHAAPACQAVPALPAPTALAAATALSASATSASLVTAATSAVSFGPAAAIPAIPLAAPAQAPSNGMLVAARYAASGAREEGALGLPSVFEVGVIALGAAQARGASAAEARIDTLFALMAHISDSNVYHRAGVAGAFTVRAEARRFMDLGGTANVHWRAEALACHRLFVRRRLSPGGAADLLAASCLVRAIAALDAAAP